MTVAEKYGCTSLDEVVAKAGRLADGDPENGVGQNPDAAMAIYMDVMLESPDHPGCLYGAGVVMREACRYPFALQLAKRICEVKPRDPRGWKLMSQIYGEMHRYDESIRYAEKALECQRNDYTLADYAYAHCNVGNYAKALAACDEALKQPATALNREAMRNVMVTRGHCELGLGKWKEGFASFRATMRTKHRKERVYDTATGPTVEWNGEPDAVVVVTGEQGLGDEIMAAGMIPSVKCRKFVFDCDERLAPIFARSFPDVIVTPTRRQDSLRTPVMPTHHKTLFGLGEIVRQSDADFPRVAYLKPDHNLRVMFQALRRQWSDKPLIGLAWSGGLPRTGMEQRRAGLNAFLPLIRRGDAEFVSLEYKDDAAEVAAFEAQYGFKVRRLPWATQGKDMDLLAALLAECTEVIGVATTALHLSSAMGVPTTIVTNRGLGWQFTPPELLWYPPTTRMWRKQSGESWRDSIARLVESRKA